MNDFWHDAIAKHVSMDHFQAVPQFIEKNQWFARIAGSYSHIGFVVSPKTQQQHWVLFRESGDVHDHNWAELALMVDWVHDHAVPHKGALSPQDPHVVVLHYCAVTTTGIDPVTWTRTHPDVPWALAWPFVFWHEMGHAVSGPNEGPANQFAFEKLNLQASKQNKPWETPSVFTYARPL